MCHSTTISHDRLLRINTVFAGACYILDYEGSNADLKKILPVCGGCQVPSCVDIPNGKSSLHVIVHRLGVAT